MTTDQLRNKFSHEIDDVDYDKLDSPQRKIVDRLMAAVKDHVDYVIGEDVSGFRHTPSLDVNDTNNQLRAEQRNRAGAY